MAVKLCTLNCNGLLTEARRNSIFQRIVALNLDFVFLQEIFVRSLQQCLNWIQSIHYHGFISLGTGNSKGTAILVKKNLSCKIDDFSHDYDGRLVKLDCTLNTVAFRFLSVYVPNDRTERSDFLDNLPHFLVTTRNLILGGDFNCVENIDLDKSGSQNFGSHGSIQIQEIKQNFGLADIFRVLYPEMKAFSFTNGRMSSRLDRFYISQSFVSNVLSITHTPCVCSDHSWVDISFDLPNDSSVPRSQNYWKLNVSILEQSEVVNAIEDLWFHDLSKCPVRDGAWWDLCKSRFKEVLIKKSQDIAKATFMKVKRLEKDLVFLQNLQANSMVPGFFDNQVKSIKSELNSFLIKKLEGSKIRAKALFIESAEKPTKYFLRREVENGGKKTIDSLEENGIIYDDLPSILNLCKSFYENLFSYENIDVASMSLFLKDLPKLSESRRDSCEGHITFDECLNAIKAMKNFKTPGSDGLPKEFYAKFFYLFGKDFVNMINLCYEFECLTPSQRRCIITLLCKKFDLKRFLSFWRPISLLNCDYKIAAKVLANRLKVVAPSIVHPDQTCAIIGRSISSNCHLLRNIIDFCNEKNVPCCLINLDQSKAFDRVSHKFLFATLEAFGFGPSFIKWIKLLYNKCDSSVIVNGTFTDSFSVGKGIRQGCPLSSLLYVLSIEPFAHAIRNDPYIKGFCIPGSLKQARISVFADDNTPIVSNINSIKRVFQVSEHYGLASGSRLNLSKSCGLLLGSAREWQIPQDFCGIKWVDSAKVLGCRFGKLDLAAQNWDPLFSKIEKSLDLYKSRNLSLRGRAVIANTCALAKLWYLGRVLTCPNNFISKVHRLVFQFIWNDRREAISRNTLFLPVGKGGIGIFNIFLKFKAFAIQHIADFLHGEWAPWKDLAKYWISLDLRRFKPDIFNNLVPHSLNKPDFYKNAVAVFKNFMSKHPQLDIAAQSSSAIYSLLLSDMGHTPNIVSRMGTLDFGPIFKSVNDKMLSPEIRSLTFKVVHHVLSTNSLLFRFNIVNCAKCPMCKSEDETISHLFFQCPVVVALWGFLEDIFFNLCNHRLKPSYMVVAFGILPFQANATVSSVIRLLVGMAKYCIWTLRCKMVFQNQSFTHLDLIEFFIRTLKYRVLADAHRFNHAKFKKFWCINNVICAKTRNHVDFLL